MFQSCYDLIPHKINGYYVRNFSGIEISGRNSEFITQFIFLDLLCRKIRQNFTSGQVFILGIKKTRTNTFCIIKNSDVIFAYFFNELCNFTCRIQQIVENKDLFKYFKN